MKKLFTKKVVWLLIGLLIGGTSTHLYYQSIKPAEYSPFPKYNHLIKTIEQEVFYGLSISIKDTIYLYLNDELSQTLLLGVNDNVENKISFIYYLDGIYDRMGLDNNKRDEIYIFNSEDKTKKLILKTDTAINIQSQLATIVKEDYQYPFIVESSVGVGDKVLLQKMYREKGGYFSTLPIEVLNFEIEDRGTYYLADFLDVSCFPMHEGNIVFYYR